MFFVVENVNEIATNIDEENILSHKIPFLLNPWTSPPQRPADVLSLWKNYRILYNFVFQQLPHLFVENCSNANSIIPSHLSYPMRANHDLENSANIAIVVTDEENSSTGTAFNAQNPVPRSTSPARRLRPYFHSEILEPHREPKKTLIITQTLTDSSDNDVSVTVRIPLRKRPSTSNEFHSEITLTKDFLSQDSNNRPNGTKIQPIEYPNNYESKISNRIVKDKNDNSESAHPYQCSNLSNIVKFHSSNLIENNHDTSARSSENKNINTSCMTTQMHSSYKTHPNTNSSQSKYNKNISGTNISELSKNQHCFSNSEDCDRSIGQNTSKLSNDCKNPLTSSIDFDQQNRIRSAIPCVFKSEVFTGHGNNDNTIPNSNFQHNSSENGSHQLDHKQIIKHNNNDINSATSTISRKSNNITSCKNILEESKNCNIYNYSPSESQSADDNNSNSISNKSNQSNEDYQISVKETKSFNSDITDTQHSTLPNHPKFQSNKLADPATVPLSMSSDSTNGSHQFQDPTKSLLKVTDDLQSQSSSEDSDLSDDHSDASSVDFWKEIAENEEDLFFKTSRSKSRTQQSATQQPANEQSKPVWNLGKDVRDFCNYTELSDSTDTSSTSSGDQNKDSFDKSNQNDMTSSCSSDENESYEVYKFKKDEPPDSRPPREDVKAEFMQIQDDLKKEADTDVDEDSGMNSDTGRNCSETEVESEAVVGQDLLKPSIKYERARTHSRLYRLLLEEEKKPSKWHGSHNPCKQSLMLPLNGNLSFVESVSSSSGINSPISPVVSEKLVNELVQNVLKWKNGPDLSKFSIEKLREIAIRSLQGDGTDSSRGSSPYSPFLMANDLDTIRSDTPRHFDFNNPTKEFADSSALYYPGFNVIPSPALKTLQSGRNSPKTWPKCPLVSKSSRSYLSKQTSQQSGNSKR